jgi:uncharacterized protein with von Willebrand factor type A (vWA) domain
MDEVKMVIDELIKREYTYEEYLQGDPDNIDMWTNKKRQISASLRILDIANKYGIDRAIATLTAAQPLGDAAVPVLEAAGKCDREACLKYLERVNEDEEMTDREGRCIYPLMQLRALVESLPDDAAKGEGR